MLKKLLVSRNELRELENIDARNLDVLIAIFLLQVKKKRRRTIRHLIKHGLDWIGKTWTGLTKHGLIKHVVIKHGLKKHRLNITNKRRHHTTPALSRIGSYVAFRASL